ncbi:hypothetical protein R0K18_33880, partial [Pantoea sp. SIMBA_133]
VDEAHNLVDRAREMYSAELTKSPFLTLKRAYKNHNNALSKAAAELNRPFLDYRKSTQNGSLVLSEVDEELIVQLDTFVQES